MQRYFIDRETILEIAKLLDIKHKENAIVEKDNFMLKKAGNNKKPKIIEHDLNKLSELVLR